MTSLLQRRENVPKQVGEEPGRQTTTGQCQSEATLPKTTWTLVGWGGCRAEAPYGRPPGASASPLLASQRPGNSGPLLLPPAEMSYGEPDGGHWCRGCCLTQSVVEMASCLPGLLLWVILEALPATGFSCPFFPSSVFLAFFPLISCW